MCDVCFVKKSISFFTGSFISWAFFFRIFQSVLLGALDGGTRLPPISLPWALASASTQSLALQSLLRDDLPPLSYLPWATHWVPCSLWDTGQAQWHSLASRLPCRSIVFPGRVTGTLPDPSAAGIPLPISSLCVLHILISTLMRRRRNL